MRQTLLACRVLGSLLYAATDVPGGLRYPGYDFGSRAISELMATGAPSEALVDPLFLAYGALALAFGVGVLWEGAGRSRDPARPQGNRSHDRATHRSGRSCGAGARVARWSVLPPGLRLAPNQLAILALASMSLAALTPLREIHQPE